MVAKRTTEEDAILGFVQVAGDLDFGCEAETLENRGGSSIEEAGSRWTPEPM